ncbi:alpha/beta hydrolase family protein [Nocardia flavorosea]|nr:prolyl oligopeptidase family serine peptidase [Nocardia flavorosea]
METITGTAAGVPYTALPPDGGVDAPAPLIVSWHMLDAPRTDAAFAAALPMAGVPAWRVHLGMPMCGARMVDGRVDAVLELARHDALRAFLAPFAQQAADEFPAALAALRDQLPVGDGPVGILGASLGGTVALEVPCAESIPIRHVALVNPALRIRSVVPITEGIAGYPYEWTAEAERAADRPNFVARAAELTVAPALLVVSGEEDHPDLRADAAALVDTLQHRYAQRDNAELVSVPNLAHPLADEPGIEPAPQRPEAKVVDDILTRWFRRQLLF